MQRLRWIWPLLGLTSIVAAADGNYDTTWGNAGRLQLDVTTTTSDVGRRLIIQPDGKLLMGGTCGADSICATRQLPNGSYDASFGPATHPGRILFSDVYAIPSSLSAMALIPGGGAWFAGNYVGPASHVGVIVKLDAEGHVTYARSIAPGNDYILYDMAVQPDGKVVVLGQISDNVHDFIVSRFNAALEDDLAFGDNGSKIIGFSPASADTPVALAIGRDGKIVVAGITNNLGAIARLLPNGQLDDDPVVGFGDGGMVTFDLGWPTAANAIAIDRDGSIVVAGYAYGKTGPNPSFDFFVNRLTVHGAQDPSFGLACPPPACDAGPVYFDLSNLPGGSVTDVAETLAIQSDRKIVVSGYGRGTDSISHWAAVRLSPYGDRDLSFGNSGEIVSCYDAICKGDDASAIAIGNGGIMIAGYTKEQTGSDYRFGIAKLKLDLIFTDRFD